MAAKRNGKVNFYYVSQEGRIRIYPEFKRFSIRTKGELISDLILRLLGLRALLISSGYWKKRAVCYTPPLVNKGERISFTVKLSREKKIVFSEIVLSPFLYLTTCCEGKVLLVSGSRISKQENVNLFLLYGSSDLTTRSAVSLMLVLVSSSEGSRLSWVGGLLGLIHSHKLFLQTKLTMKQFFFEHSFSTPSSFVNQLRKRFCAKCAFRAYYFGQLFAITLLKCFSERSCNLNRSWLMGQKVAQNCGRKC